MTRYGPLENKTKFDIDRLQAINPPISNSSRSLVLQIPIGGLETFFNSSCKTDKVLPSDLKRFFVSLWKGSALEV